MTEPAVAAPPRRSLTWLVLYALAYGGGVVAYVPLLTLLLPIKVEAIAPDAKVAVLSLATLLGAVAASVANIAGGMVSDRDAERDKGRRPWVWLGLAALAASYLALHLASTTAWIVAGVVMFQLSLNFMLAPLLAIAADEVPDAQKGFVGGLFGAVYPLGSLAGVAVTLSPALGEATQLAMVVAMVALLIMPFLLVMRRRQSVEATEEAVAAKRASGLRNLTLVWLARLLIQIAGIILFAYLLYYFETVDRGEVIVLNKTDLPAQIAQLSGVTAVLIVPLSLALGRMSDMAGSRKLILAAMAGAMAAGLLVMALLPEWRTASIGYMVFACASAVFLSIQNTYAMQLMPSSRNRGRDLGILNLTNTLPPIVAAVMAAWLASTHDFTVLLLVLSGLTALGGVLMLWVRETGSDRGGRNA